MLTIKKKAFSDQYILTGNASDSARKAGYSVKTAAQIGSRLLKDKSVQEYLQAYQTQQDALMEEKRKEISKDSFVETAWNKFETTEEASIKPRYLEIAGRALGYLSNQSDSRPHQTLNISLTNIDLNGKTQNELWELARNLLG